MIQKSDGKTRTEKLLSDLCENTFLNIWSYPNPYNEKGNGKEFCDLVAIFENHMFIFFDRENKLHINTDKDPLIKWDRWKRNVIDAQTKTCHGAERYIKNGGNLFLDPECKIPFPIKYDFNTVIVHKVIIANGASEACMDFSKENVNGSIGISYKSLESHEVFKFPFLIDIDKNNPIHVFDEYTFPLILTELDTFKDFLDYITTKEDAINDLKFLSYCGEEDLLAHYLMNFNNETKKHYIGSTSEKFNGLMIAEGEWDDFKKTPAYSSRKSANEISYFWDDLLKYTLSNALKGVLKGNSDIFNGKSALYEMAKEPRLSRRVISKIMVDSINRFPINDDPLIRNLNYFESYYKNIGYVFLQLKYTLGPNDDPEFRKVRQFMLSIACGAAKLKFPTLKTVIGIAMDPPKVSKNHSEDFMLLDCSNWSKEDEDYYMEENSHDGFKFFMLDSLKAGSTHETEFPDSRLKS